MKPHDRLSPYASGRANSAGQIGRSRLLSRNAIDNGIAITYAVKNSLLATSRPVTRARTLTIA